jgi:hypothetical protein
MRKMLSSVLVIGLALIALTPVYAQVHSDIAADRAQLQSDRQAIVAANLPMSEEQAKAFWPMYREYRGELQKLGDRLVDLVMNYAKSYESLSDPQANDMLKNYLAIQKDEIKIKSDWASKFGKVLPPKSVLRFYQIENKLDAVVRYEAADQVPLAETEKK